MSPALVKNASFKWPSDLGDSNAESETVIRAALKLAGLTEASNQYWEFYKIYAPGSSLSARRIKPGQEYEVRLVNPPSITFVWTGPSAPSSSQVTIAKALDLAGFGFLDPDDYYITDKPFKKSLQFRRGSDGNVHTGQRYYLSII